MAFKSTGVAVESIVFNGYKYNRYPESSNPAHRRYFARAGHRLHRDVWVYYNGPISKGMHVHHIDGDTSNNDISNLACITKDEHWSKHRAEISERNRRPEQLEHLARIRSSSAAWHKSPEGRAWHREHAKTSLAKTWSSPRHYPDIDKVCFWCGTQFVGQTVKAKFCKKGCQTAESRFRLGKSSYQHPYHASRLRSDGGG